MAARIVSSGPVAGAGGRALAVWANLCGKQVCDKMRGSVYARPCGLKVRSANACSQRCAGCPLSKVWISADDGLLMWEYQTCCSVCEDHRAQRHAVTTHHAAPRSCAKSRPWRRDKTNQKLVEPGIVLSADSPRPHPPFENKEDIRQKQTSCRLRGWSEVVQTSTRC